jgi:hypothetical protein
LGGESDHNNNPHRTPSGLVSSESSHMRDRPNPK